jgi:hypothetical protein
MTYERNYTTKSSSKKRQRRVTIQFWENYHAVHVSFARTVSYVHLPEAHSFMNCILLSKTE